MFTKYLNDQRKQFLSTISLLIAGYIFPYGLAPFNLWPATIISLGFLCHKIFQQPNLVVFSRVFSFNCGLFFCGVSWLHISIHEHGFVSLPLAILATLFFCVFVAIISSVPFLLWKFLPKIWVSHLLAFPSLWVLGEFFRSWFATGFPWLFAGYSLQTTWLAGWAPLGGVFWLSFMACFTASFIAQMYRRRLTRVPKIFCTIAILSAFVTGFLLFKVNWTVPIDPVLSVTLIQPNIAQSQKWSPDRRDMIMRQLARQTESHWDQDLIVWPEAAVPAIPQNIPHFMKNIEQLALQNNNTLITGIPTFDDESELYRNSVIALGANPGRYDKSRLVPFGEYVPFESILRGLIRFFNLPMSNFSRGATDQPLIKIGDHLLSSAICYEVVYPDLVARISRGSSLLLTVSNDSWFGNSWALPQHLQMAQMRALENGKPMLRATNNGLTGVINRHGALVDVLQPFRQGELVGKVQPRIGQTPFSLWGSWPCILLCFIIIAILHRLESYSREV